MVLGLESTNVFPKDVDYAEVVPNYCGLARLFYTFISSEYVMSCQPSAMSLDVFLEDLLLRANI